MRIRWRFIVLLLIGCVAASATELLDRTVATVNGRVILLSDWQDEVRFECLSAGRKLEAVTADDKKAALDRLIDQQLLREQMHAEELKALAPERIQQQVQGLKDTVLRNNAGESWEKILSRYQLSGQYVEGRVRAELEQLQFIDARFRPSIQVSPAEIEQYYKEQLVPKLPPSDPVELSDVTPKIREILVQSKMNQMLSSWLQTLRSQAQVRMLADVSDPSVKSLQAGAQ